VALNEGRVQRQRSDISLWSKLALSCRKLAESLLAQGEVDRAAPMVLKSLQLAERWSDEQKKSREAKNELMGSLILVARLRSAEMESGLQTGKFGLEAPPNHRADATLQEVGRLTTASESAYGRALTLANELLQQDPKNSELLLTRIRCQIGIAARRAILLQRGLPGVDTDSVQTLGKFPDLDETLERIANENHDKDEYQYEVALIYRNLGDIYALGEKNAAAALTAYRKSLAILRRLTGRDRSNPQLQLDLVILYRGLADIDQPWINVPSLLDPHYRSYMKPPVVPQAEVIPLLQDGLLILARLNDQGILTPTEQDLRRELLVDVNDLQCQQKGFESALGEKCIRPLPTQAR
jgi:tetratricopeptide (TPR) repeat protein